MPCPPATHIVPLNATHQPFVENIDVPKPTQVTPSNEYAILFVPEPTATHFSAGEV